MEVFLACDFSRLCFSARRSVGKKYFVVMRVWFAFVSWWFLVGCRHGSGCIGWVADEGEELS